MKPHCPKCSAHSQHIRKAGFFFRKSDSQKIRRYKCMNCKKSFSSATFSANFNQNKRRINPLVRKLLSSATSHRRIALVLGINRKTVTRKRKFLAKQAQKNQKEWLQEQKFSQIQFDDLETIEHTKLKPLTVTLLVNHKRKIIGFGVARIRAKGHLAKLSVKKYGKRPNEAPAMRRKLFSEIAPHIHPQALIETDEHLSYPDLIKNFFPQAEHLSYKSSRSCIAGQGELKKVKFDPLFKINHTFAMLRANISRLVRKTWNTTKCVEALREHLHIYMDFHNQELTS